MKKAIRIAVRTARKATGIRYKKIQNDEEWTEEEIKSVFKKENTESESSDGDINFEPEGDIKSSSSIWKIKDTIELCDGITRDEVSNIISMKRVLSCYFAILKKHFKASIPKYIVKFLIDDSIRTMRSDIITNFIEYDKKIELSKEDTEVCKERDMALHSMKSLKKAKKAIRNVKKGEKFINE